MKRIGQIRRDNLELLIDEVSGVRSFCDITGKSESQLSQWSNASVDSKSGKPRVMSNDIAYFLEEKFDKPIGWMDNPAYISNDDDYRAISRSDIVDADSIRIPVLSNKGSMGDGCELADGDIVITSMSVQKEWLNEHIPNSKPANLSFIHGAGDSMSPTFYPGDVLLVDTGLTTADIDGVYAMVANGQLFIKRVTRKMDGSLVVTSDNPNVKTSESLNGDTDVEIKGRIVWAWNGKRL